MRFVSHSPIQHTTTLQAISILSSFFFHHIVHVPCHWVLFLLSGVNVNFFVRYVIVHCWRFLCLWSDWKIWNEMLIDKFSLTTAAWNASQRHVNVATHGRHAGTYIPCGTKCAVVTVVPLFLFPFNTFNDYYFMYYIKFNDLLNWICWMSTQLNDSSDRPNRWQLVWTTKCIHLHLHLVWGNVTHKIDKIEKKEKKNKRIKATSLLAHEIIICIQQV